MKLKKRLKVWYKQWKREFLDHKYLILISLILLALAYLVSFIASTYVDSIITTIVPDLILDHIPVLDLDMVFGYGIIIVISTIFIYTVFFRIKDAHRVTFQFSLLLFVRSFFMVLTHLGKPAVAKAVTDLPAFYQLFNFHNDLFFSAHTAVPFMAFLIFRKEKIGKFFLLMAIILAITVLFMHVHYSIDVFSAFFITFGVYTFGEWFCKKVYH